MSKFSDKGASEIPQFSLVFLWHKTPFKQKIAFVVISVFALTLAFGLGLIAQGKQDRAPIIIEQCVD